MSFKKILIVDDEFEIAESIAEFILENYEIQAEVARDGREAKWKLENTSYFLLLTDLKMSNFSGINLIQDIQSGKIKQKPVHTWLMSGYVSKEQLSLLTSHNMTVFQKPIDFEFLKNKLDIILQFQKSA